MAVRIRMKRLGRKNRPFYRVVAVDSRGTRDGRVIEYLGHYDPKVTDTDGRALLNGERIDYWLKVGAQPSDKVRVLIKKYGSNGTHVSQQRLALEKLKLPKQFSPPAPLTKPKKKGARDEAPEAATPEAATPEAATPEAASPALETTAQEN